MQVVILAAGRGERLWPLTRNTPKCLLEITNGMSVLDMQMQALSAIPEITEVIYVLGHLAEQIEAKLLHYNDTHLDIRTVYNPFFAESNNLMSLWFSLPYLRDNIIVVNGDDIYDRQVPAGLVAVEREQNIVMTIDRKEKYDDDDMKVITKGERILRVSKRIDPNDANGESIGMIRFCGTGTDRLKDTLNRLVHLPVGREIFWLKAVQELIDQGYTVNWYECATDQWAEIDFHPDLQMVRSSLLDHHSESIRRWAQTK